VRAGCAAARRRSFESEKIEPMDDRSVREGNGVTDRNVEDPGGDRACYLNLTCPECGAVLEEERPTHLSWCSSAAGHPDEPAGAK
jgi:hypothetical protein